MPLCANENFETRRHKGTNQKGSNFHAFFKSSLVPLCLPVSKFSIPSSAQCPRSILHASVVPLTLPIECRVGEIFSTADFLTSIPNFR